MVSSEGSVRAVRLDSGELHVATGAAPGARVVRVWIDGRPFVPAVEVEADARSRGPEANKLASKPSRGDADADADADAIRDAAAEEAEALPSGAVVVLLALFVVCLAVCVALLAVVLQRNELDGARAVAIALGVSALLAAVGMGVWSLRRAEHRPAADDRPAWPPGGVLVNCPEELRRLNELGLARVRQAVEVGERPACGMGPCGRDECEDPACRTYLRLEGQNGGEER